MPAFLSKLLQRLGLGGPGVGDKLLGGAFLVLCVRVLGAGCSYLVMLLLIRWLGVTGFGVYTYVLSWTTILGLLLPLGLNASVLRFVPEYQERNFAGRLRGVVSRSRAIVTLSSLVGMALGLLVAYLLRDRIDPDYFWPIIVALCTVPIFSQLDLHESLTRAFGWPVLAYAPPYVLEPVLLMLGLGFLLLVGVTLNATIAMGVMLVAALLCVLCQVFTMEYRVGRTLRSRPPRYHTRYWVAVSMPLLLMEGFRAILEHADILMLGTLAAPEDVAAYVTVVRLAGLLGFVMFAVNAIAAPRIPEAYFGGRSNQLPRLYGQIILLTFIPTLLGAIVLVTAGPWVLAFFSPEFTAAYPALLILIAAALFRSLTGPVEYLLSLTGHQRDCVPVYIVVGLFNITANFVLIKMWGLLGASMATALSGVLMQGWLAWLVWRRLQLVPSFQRAPVVLSEAAP